MKTDFSFNSSFLIWAPHEHKIWTSSLYITDPLLWIHINVSVESLPDFRGLMCLLWNQTWAGVLEVCFIFSNANSCHISFTLSGLFKMYQCCISQSDVLCWYYRSEQEVLKFFFPDDSFALSLNPQIRCMPSWSTALLLIKLIPKHTPKIFEG